jgi:hypothetical protein
MEASPKVDFPAPDSPIKHVEAVDDRHPSLFLRTETFYLYFFHIQ